MFDSADQIIQHFELLPHPEGGFYKEVYRAELEIESPVAGGIRSGVTDIYYLLRRGEFSRFHSVVHDEIWNFYLGGPLNLYLFDGENVKPVTLGDTNTPGFKYTVPGGVYQAAEPLGDYTLVGCTVAPGFDFADFRFLSDDTAMLKKLEKKWERLV